MSVTVSDILKLPSLQEAKVVAGYAGLNRTVSSITVLEMDDPKVVGVEAYGHPSKFGSEIVITAFAFVRDDIDLQCDALNRLHAEGQIAVILYYVGRILLKLDDRLMELANKLEMPLIVMPEGLMELRYSDVIYEVIEAIIKDRETNTYFATELIERLSHIDAAHRSITAVLAVIRDRTHCSVFLADEGGRWLNFAAWPNERCLPIDDIMRGLNDGKSGTEIRRISINEKSFYAKADSILCNDSTINAIIIKEDEGLSESICDQIKCVLKTYVNLWTENYGQLNTKQLICAILNDEPEKMRLIGEKLKIDVKALSYTYFFYSSDSNDHEYRKLKLARETIKEFVSGYKNVFLTDIFDETVVVFADRNREKLDNDLPVLLQELRDRGLDYRGIVIDTVSTTEDAKASYWMYQKYKKFLPVVFKNKTVITGGELELVKRAKELFDKGDYLLEEYIRRRLSEERNQEELINTLETFLLDADGSLVKTAQIMFVHKNTIKYRIKTLESVFGHKLTRMPEQYDLYITAAVCRLKGSFE